MSFETKGAILLGAISLGCSGFGLWLMLSGQHPVLAAQAYVNSGIAALMAGRCAGAAWMERDQPKETE